MTDGCAIPGCHGETEIVYLDHGICEMHWNRLNDNDQPAAALARALGISVADATATETAMKNELHETGPDPATDTTAAETATTEATMKSAAKKNAKSTKKAKAGEKARTTKAKAPKAEKTKREKVRNDATRTFAIRISDAELEAIHAAAGPRNATRYIRLVAAAFAAGDDAAFKAVVKEAREARV